MPVVGGNMYPELRERILDPTDFNILILRDLGSEYLTLLSSLEVLHSYIEDEIVDNTLIKLHILKSNSSNFFEEQDKIEFHELENGGAIDIARLIANVDADVVLCSEEQISDKEALTNDSKYLVVRDLDGLESACETFLTGRNIPWMFKDPTWDTTWFARYYTRQGLCRDTYNFMVFASSQLGYSNEQVQRVRYLTNRIGQIEYSRDLLNAYLQKKRRARRQGFDKQSYNFELEYHLSNYYFLLSGGFDIIARLLNDVFSLGITKYSALGVEKKDFLKLLTEVQPDIAELYRENKTKEWIEWLKERRNFIAHDASMYHTQLVTEKELKMTPEELVRKVDERTIGLKEVLTPSGYETQRAVVESLVKRDDYDEIANDIMVVETVAGRQKLFLPLRNIDYDYDHFHGLVSRTLASLRKVG